jgi:hypothetical protein
VTPSRLVAGAPSRRVAAAPRGRVATAPRGWSAAPSALLSGAGILTLLVAGGLYAGVPANMFLPQGPGRTATPPGREPFLWRGKLAPGKTVEVQGLNGNVRAELTDGDQAEVSAVKNASRGDTAAVRLEVVEHSGGVTICALYPGRNGRRPTCSPGEGDHGDVQNSDVRVDFTVRVPHGVGFVGRTIQGDVTAEGLAGPVQAYSVNGSIRFTTSGSGLAETVNGSITAALGSTQAESPLNFRTVNGQIKLSLRPEAGAEVRAETMNGRISSDFPLAGAASHTQNRMQGTIGAGGGRLDLETVNGNIEIRRTPTS